LRGRRKKISTNIIRDYPGRNGHIKQILQRDQEVVGHRTHRLELSAVCADALVPGIRSTAQLVSKFNQAKIQVALACAYKLKTGKAVRFAQERVLN
jgi:hypothetical protein